MKKNSLSERLIQTIRAKIKDQKQINIQIKVLEQMVEDARLAVKNEQIKTQEVRDEVAVQRNEFLVKLGDMRSMYHLELQKNRSVYYERNQREADRGLQSEERCYLEYFDDLYGLDEKLVTLFNNK